MVLSYKDYETNPDYKEILVLDKMLTEANIPHETRKAFDGWQIYYPSELHCKADAIEHFGSFGSQYDLLEIMGLLTAEELEHDTVKGYMTAQEVFSRIQSVFNAVDR